VTSKPVGKGTGLGLSISHQVIHQTHRGRLWFDSQVGRGTAFHIEIPIHQDIPSQALSQTVAAVS
jgi:signal transduction histidine kinase